jgi:hypothetical protein
MDHILRFPVSARDWRIPFPYSLFLCSSVHDDFELLLPISFARAPPISPADASAAAIGPDHEVVSAPLQALVQSSSLEVTTKQLLSNNGFQPRCLTRFLKINK